MKQYIKTTVDGKHQLLPDPGPGKELKFWQQEVGGYVAPKYMSGGIVLLYNRDSLFLGLPQNRSIRCLMGDALIGEYTHQHGETIITGFDEKRAQEVFAELETKRREREALNAF